MTENNIEIKMADDSKTGITIMMGILSLIMGVLGIVLHYLLPILFFETILAAEAGNPCVVTAPIFFPIFADIGILGGILWILAGIAFLQKKKWGYTAAVFGVVFSLKASFWPNIPTMEGGAVLPVWFLIFLPNLVMYFVLLRSMRNESWIKMLFGMFTGMAFILNFINGIASTTRMIQYSSDFDMAGVFILTQRLGFIASILFGIATIGLFVAKKKEWVRIVGLSGAIVSMVGGFPLAIHSMILAFQLEEKAFSMFIMAPVLSTVVGIVFLFPGIWNWILGTEKTKNL